MPEWWAFKIICWFKKRYPSLYNFWLLGTSKRFGRLWFSFCPSSLVLPRLTYWSDGGRRSLNFSIASDGCDPFFSIDWTITEEKDGTH